MVMAVVLGAAVVFMAGCGKKEEPAASIDSLKAKTDATVKEGVATADKAAADAKVAADKAAADAKKAADAAKK
ncbi:MAG: hypothetical protein A2X45_12295 [Lentisphaerae bacterium GWF2_50_93]|nr:MAG: hypothetical protein A2X45_12295 [Lentisphaerae bacterium GWF2_50_93]